jgi:hypothetical protein
VAQSIIPGILSGDQVSKLVFGAIEHGVPLASDADMASLLATAAGRLHVATRCVPAVPLYAAPVVDGERANSEANRGASAAGFFRDPGRAAAAGEGGGEGSSSSSSDEAEAATVLLSGAVELKGIIGSDNRKCVFFCHSKRPPGLLSRAAGPRCSSAFGFAILCTFSPNARSLSPFISVRFFKNKYPPPRYVLDLLRLTPRDANWCPQRRGGTGKWEAAAAAAQAASLADGAFADLVSPSSASSFRAGKDTQPRSAAHSDDSPELESAAAAGVAAAAAAGVAAASVRLGRLSPLPQARRRNSGAASPTPLMFSPLQQASVVPGGGEEAPAAPPTPSAGGKSLDTLLSQVRVEAPLGACTLKPRTVSTRGLGGTVQSIHPSVRPPMVVCVCFFFLGGGLSSPLLPT